MATDRASWTPWLGWMGAILMLGGIGHSVGVVHFYRSEGVPIADRIVIDVWVAQAQLLGGGLYLAAQRRARDGGAWRTLAVFAALTVLGFTATMVPILFTRAPLYLLVPALTYLTASAAVLARLLWRGPKLRGGCR